MSELAEQPQDSVPALLHELRYDLDRLAKSVANLAVAYSQHTHPLPESRWDRFRAWIREYVYDGTPQ